MEEQIPNQIPDAFGNYMLKGIVEIPPVPSIPFDFGAPGWPYLGALLVVIICYFCLRLWRRWRTNAYRRAALKMLHANAYRLDSDPLDALKPLPALLKTTAMIAFGRNQVTALRELEWLEFLDASCPHLKGEHFTGPLGRSLYGVAYQNPTHFSLSAQDARDLFNLCQTWIKHHEVEKHD
jgi:hypothetical protein